MSVLKPIPSILDAIIEQVPPAKECEVCKTMVAVQHNGIFFHHIIVISSGGDPSLPAFQCPNETGEHFVCSVNCLEIASHACLDEHMIPLAKSIEQRVKGVQRG